LDVKATQAIEDPDPHILSYLPCFRSFSLFPNKPVFENSISKNHLCIMAPMFVTATIEREVDAPVGLTLKPSGNDKLIIDAIDAQSPFVGSSLRVGMEVKSINNVDCSVLSKASAMKLLRSEDLLTVLAQQAPPLPEGTVVTASLNKATKETKTGLVLRKIEGQMVISDIRDGSLASLTTLRPGMVVKKVNNADISGIADVREAVGLVTILACVPTASDSEDAKPTDGFSNYLTAHAENVDEGVGLGLVDEEGNVVIDSIDSKGAFFGSPLRVGMQILQVNNMACTSAEEAMTMLKESGAQVTVLAAKSESRFAPGAILNIIVHKETAQTKSGINLVMRDELCVVTNVRDGTPAAMTALQPGMIVHSINNLKCQGMPSGHVSGLLSSASGRITILAEVPPAGTETTDFDSSKHVTATMYKEDSSDKVGLSLTGKGGNIIVSKIVEGSLAASTDLKVGMAISQINNQSVTELSSTGAASLLAETQGILTILARQHELPEGAYVTGSFVKATAETKVGMKLGNRVQAEEESVASGAQDIVITKIAEGSLASMTKLEEGMVVNAINNVDCTGMTPAEAAKLLVESSGMIVVLASARGVTTDVPLTEVVTASMTKSDKFGEIDSAVERNGQGKVVITERGASTVFFGSTLRAGMEILSINNIDCSVLSPVAIVALLKQATDNWTILARRPELVPGAMVTQVIRKESKDQSVGMTVKAKIDTGRLLITSIRDGTLASATKLVPGMELLLINNKSCLGMLGVDCTKMISDAEGLLTIVAATPEDDPLVNSPVYVTATLEKEADSKVGITLSRKQGKMVITGVAKGSLAADSDLKVGMEVLAIANINTTEMTIPDAASLLADAQGTLAILAKRPSSPPGSLVTAAITKESASQKCGVRLGLWNGKIMIKRIDAGSPAAKTDLEPGMLVKAINNVDCDHDQPNEAAKLLAAPERTVTILAETTADTNMISRSEMISVRSMRLQSMRGSMRSSTASISPMSSVIEDEALEREEIDDEREAPEAGATNVLVKPVKGQRKVSIKGEDEAVVPNIPTKEKATRRSTVETVATEDDELCITYTTQAGTFTTVVSHIVEC
jgi:C-terminal processing protease CtpA/Prc